MAQIVRRKVLPIAKTVVVEFLSKVVDKVGTSIALKNNIAVPVKTTDRYVYQDLTVSETPTEITGVSKLLILHSFQKFSISLTQDGVELPPIVCDGMFIFTGPIEKVTLFLQPVAAGDPTELRVSAQYC